MKRITGLLLLALLCAVHGSAQQASSAPPAVAITSPTLTSAENLYNSGDFLRASEEYKALVTAYPTSIPARVGLVRSYLKMEKVKEAFDTANKGLAADLNAAPLHSVMGDVRFRRGELAQAELEYRAALNTDKQNIEAILGLARIYTAFSLHKHAYDLLNAAHKIAPEDPEVRRAWLRTLSSKERIQALEEYLKGANGDTEETKESLNSHLEYLKMVQSFPKHGCDLVTKVESTDLEMQPMLLDAHHLHGWGLNVQINNKKTRLTLDTGASGLVISRKMAERAGLERISEGKSGGIGDKGPVGTFTAYAAVIKIGNLEFHDCVVDVIDRRSVVDDDGLIGADVFSDYLIDIDFPGQKLKLSPLPKRPDDNAEKKTSLNTGGDRSGSDEHKADEDLPQDRYVAPDMQGWTKIFRFGHMLLIPTKVNDGVPRMFLLDTGAFGNTFSPELAREVTKVSTDDTIKVKGISGYVDKVMSADQATLAFGHLRQRNEETVTFDISNISRAAGTEVAGILGYATFAVLEVKIDYRDGLVDFVYEPKRTNSQFLRTK